jgi:hypothetical protein
MRSWIDILRKGWVGVVAGFVYARNLWRRVECEELSEEFWLGYGDSTVCIVCEVESEKASGLAIQDYLVVLADVGYDSVDVGLG